MYVKGKTVDQQKEPFIVLGSELVHSLLQMDGYDVPSYKKGQNTYINKYGDQQTETQSIAELQAHGIGSYSIPGNTKRSFYPTENTLKKENKRPLRAAYESSLNYFNKYNKNKK